MPATFGQMLTAAREKRGLSIEDAAHETRIPAQRLRLLETDNIAGFGSMTYARSFIRAYSEYLELDPTSFLEDLPEGVLGGERDYRYLTQSQGAWLRERAPRTERITAPASSRLQSIKSPLPAALGVFVLVLAGTAMWGMHVAESQAKVEPAALKALPVGEDAADEFLAPGAVPPQTAAVKSKQVDFPVAPKVQRFD
jgi:cytoskeletal protein RodZ